MAAADPLQVGSSVWGLEDDSTRCAAGRPKQTWAFVYESRREILDFGRPPWLGIGQIEHWIQS